MKTAEILKALLQFDTTNPPGNERECVEWVAALLAERGIEHSLHAARPERPNLVARVSGGGSRPPLILQGHVDVVTTAGQHWQQPPFAGVEADGFLWGRGALDMKNGVAMMLAAFLRAHEERERLPGDVILCALADEEAGGLEGAAWLVENHPDLFDGARYTIGEGGGYSFEVGGRRFYPLMLGEKRGCQLKVTFRGPGGHGSIPTRGDAMAKLGTALTALDRSRLPVHLTPIVDRMLREMAAAVDGKLAELLGQMRDEAAADAALDAMGPLGRSLDAILHNTVNATIVAGGLKVNVIPSEVTLQLDGRLLPGFGPEDMLREVRGVIGDEAELEVMRLGPAQGEADFSRYDVLAEIVREMDPEGVPVPYLLSGGTDGRHFAPLGIATYGFLPVRLPAGFDWTATIHAADERIPLAALEPGSEAIFQALLRM